MFESKGLTGLLSAMTSNARFEAFNLRQDGFQFKLMSCSSDSWAIGDRPKWVEQRMKLSELPLDTGYVREDPFAIRNTGRMPSNECLESLGWKTRGSSKAAYGSYEPTRPNQGCGGIPVERGQLLFALPNVFFKSHVRSRHTFNLLGSNHFEKSNEHLTAKRLKRE